MRDTLLNRSRLFFRVQFIGKSFTLGARSLFSESKLKKGVIHDLGFTHRSSVRNEAARSKQLGEESEEQTKSREAKLLSLNWVNSNPFTVALIAKA